MTTVEKIDAIAELFELPDDAVNITIKVDHERLAVRVAYELPMDEGQALNLTMVAPDPRDRAGISNGKGGAA